ncbi:AAA family ATPase [Balneolaceae bacterium YR4-1]|uniref:AAA family ATPase n=1 Tax=Halalkalibaculum roseum TaxID=2709311 RepID=A0A6M1SX31_9BACT|nr:AAA family ATPase [Halalkalibaculum roseum]NGP76546.1 AAA family ATPase [Halalkalibaculum roseum]
MDSKLLQFLESPDSYSHAPESVEHVQTHISHVFIADPFVYKFKKPVNFEFLDFSTLEKRKHYCHREVELNRRLCDDIYLGVVEIREQGNTFMIESNEEGSIVDYAVKMKKLREEYFLHSLIDRNELNRTHLNRITDKLSDFYNSQNPGEEIRQWGEIEKIKYNTDENFRQTKSFIGETIDENSYRSIQKYTREYYDKFSALFESRIKNNCIVDGHGDLHLEHIHITPEKVRIYDCIEFNDRFRYGDTAADLAFLAMDLDFNRCSGEERYFMNRMAELLNDSDLLVHLDFYKCYRAYVKGKVKSLQSTEEEVGRENMEKARNRAREYFDLSLHYATLGSRATVLVIMGRIASGKSTIASAISNKLNIEHYSSDRIRKRIMGVPLEERADASKREQLYSKEMSLKTYERLLEEAKKHLESRESVILDATYSRREERQKFIEQMGSLGADYCFIEARATDEAIKKRLKLREQEEGIISDARQEDFEELSKYYQSPDEIAESHIIRIETESSLDETLFKLYDKLITRNLNSVMKEIGERF